MPRMRKYPPRLSAAVAAAGLVPSMSVCHVKPGDYRVYKIAMLPVSYGADCGRDVNPRDVTTFFGVQTIQLFATDADDYFLEMSDGMNDTVIVGTRDGTDYHFFGEEYNVDDP